MSTNPVQPRYQVTPGSERLALRLMSLWFAIGSSLFALGAIMPVVGLSNAANPIFVLGAIFFTSAATVQWRTAVHHSPSQLNLRQRVEFDLGNPDWSAAVVQLIGTLYFNVMTIAALVVSPNDDQRYTADVWRPDAIGSVLFLVSSAIALHPLSRQLRHKELRGRSGWIAWSNMFGAVMFGVSAVANQLVAPGDFRSEWWTNAGTFLGGLGFLLASVLMWPSSKQRDR